MKVRIGVGLGTSSVMNEPEPLTHLVTELERLRFDSVWFAERVAGATLDPVVAMTWAAAHTRKLKFGPSVMVLPGRNPVLLAKELASLDRVAGGRLLPAFGLGAVNLAEHQAFGVTREERAGWFDEALPLLRRLWREDSVDHEGPRFHLQGVRVQPKPVGKMEVWLGGVAPSELRRTGRLGDGWLPSFCTPDDVAAGLPVIDAASEKAERALIDREHIGAVIGYTADGSVPDRLVQAVKLRRPELEPTDVFVAGRHGLAARMKEFVDAGATKFVLMPFTEPDDWTAELEQLADAVLALQT